MRVETKVLSLVGDVALGAFVVAVVLMLLAPLPTTLLDALIVANVGTAVLILFASIYSPSAMRLSTFPAVLLLTTLFRLALNVSSTRLILSDADAGRVIDAVGGFVVQGNYVVGAVIFALITVVQLVVVAKGAERVSEVAARFALDAMPGKQLAIDADLRAGAIGVSAAGSRRAALEREAQLFGALDGAMKFVKGDAIAAVMITAVNVGAGILIGLTQRDMGLTEALETYTLLSIGDGLVSQIPAFLIATAAAIVVTRVGSSGGQRQLGLEVAAQLGAEPRVLALAASVLWVLAALPQFPAPPFALMGALIAVVAWRASRSLRGAAPPHEPLCVEHPQSWREGEVRGAIELAHTRASRNLGLALPQCAIRAVAETHMLVRLDGVVVARLEAQEPSALARALQKTFEEHAPELVDVDWAEQLLEDLRATNPAVVRAAGTAGVVPSTLCAVLRGLLVEGVNVQNLPRIVEALAERGSGAGPEELVACARVAVRRQLVERYVDRRGQLRAFVIEPSIDEMIASAVRVGGGGSYLALSPSLLEELVSAVRAQVAGGERGLAPVLVVSARARPHLWKVLSPELPEVVVLGRQEIPPNVVVEEVGRVVM